MSRDTLEIPGIDKLIRKLAAARQVHEQALLNTNPPRGEPFEDDFDAKWNVGEAQRHINMLEEYVLVRIKNAVHYAVEQEKASLQEPEVDD